MLIPPAAEDQARPDSVVDTNCDSPLGGWTLVRYGAKERAHGKEPLSMATLHSTLTHLAQQVAAHIGFTLRR